MMTFLDLPAEIRNIIYSLVADSAFDPENICYDRHERTRPSLVIECGLSGHSHLPAIAGVCRQIRVEFLSQALPEYQIECSERYIAQHWDLFSDETFTKYLRSLTFKIRIEISIPENTVSHGSHLKGAQSCMLHTHARYRGTPNFETVMRFNLQIKGGNQLGLDQPSRTAVRQSLSDLLNLSARNFVRAVDRICKLDLRCGKLEKPELGARGFLLGGLEFSIKRSSPMHPHEVETSIWTHRDGGLAEYCKIGGNPATRLL